MCKMRFTVVLIFLVHQCTGIIYKLNETEYNKMPDLYDLDDYDPCIAEPGGTYCLLDADLYSDTNSDLMRMIQEYSEYTIKHFNHTQIHRGLCVTRTCKDFIKGNLTNEADLHKTIEACVNQSMWDGYKLKAKLSKVLYCKRHGEKLPLEAGDFVVAIVYLILIILNVTGSFYDAFRDTQKPGNPYLLSFSIRRNWKKMIAPSGVGAEPRLNRLKLFNGYRAMTMVCVFFSHTALVMAYSYMKNPRYIETSYGDPAKMIIFNGTLVTFTFFVMSGFLLAFNFELHAEKHKVSLWEWPKGMLLRWLRLTPTYALIMFTIMTIMRHAGSGPLWDQVVTSEATACYQYWWAHILYINNYIYNDSHCVPQTWYLAADTQLFGLGLLICILFRKPRSQMIVLVIMMIISMLLPAAHTYFQGLEAVVHQTPEAYRSLYQHHDTFRYVFVAGHTNMSTYVIGISGGLLTYHWMKEGKTPKRLEKFAWAVWLAFPVGVAIILSGGFFYIDGYEPSMTMKILYSAINKPLFQLAVLTILMGAIFKVENVYRSIVEWRGFTWVGRVSYSAFLLHTLFQRGLVGSQRHSTYMSDFYIMTILTSTIFLSFASATILWMCVESPVAGLCKAAFAPPRRPPRETELENTKV